MKFILLIFAVSSIVYSQVIQEWVHRYNGTGNSFDISAKLFVDPSGNIIVSGTTLSTGSLNDVVVIKYNPGGNILWQRRYNGPGNNADQAYGTYVDALGNTYVTGFAADSALVTRFLTLKLDPNGNILWSKLYSPQNFSQGTGYDILTDNNSNVFAAGYIKAANGFNDLLILKYSSSGNLIAAQNYNGPSGNNDEAFSICLDSDGNLLVLGITKQSGQDDLVLIKYNNNLQVVASNIFNSSSTGDDKAVKVISVNNSAYICSSVHSASSGYDYSVMKQASFSGGGWLRSFNGSGNNQDLAYDMFVKNGLIYVTGSSRNADTLGSEDIAAICIDTSGNTSWQKIYDGAGHGTDFGNSVCADGDDNCYIGGASDRGGIKVTYKVLKYDRLGNLKWFADYSVASFPEDFISSIGIDQGNNVYVTGISFDTLSDYDIATIKYSQPIGIKQISTELPDAFYLSQNYPNPFNPVTKIRFDLPNVETTRRVVSTKLTVYDILGREVETLLNEELSPGAYEVEWDGSDYPSGVYFYRLWVSTPSGESGTFADAKKMILVK